RGEHRDHPDAQPYDILRFLREVARPQDAVERKADHPTGENADDDQDADDDGRHHGRTPVIPANAGIHRAAASRRQFLVLSTSLFFAIHGITARSFSPPSSIGCAALRRRIALKLAWFPLFPSIQSRANRPDWMSARMRFISARVASLMTRG